MSRRKRIDAHPGFEFLFKQLDHFVETGNVVGQVEILDKVAASLRNYIKKGTTDPTLAQKYFEFLTLLNQKAQQHEIIRRTCKDPDGRRS